MTSRRFMPFRSVRLFEPDHRDRRSVRRLPDHRRRASCYSAREFCRWSPPPA